jgi:hypothetical protein
MDEMPRNRATRRADARRGRKLAALGSGAALAATGAAATIALTAAPAGAATFTVDNLDDAGAGSLRQAVLDANAAGGPDDIAFAEGLTGTITLESQIDVTDELTINGPGASVITVSGGGDSRIFESSAPFTVRGLTFADAGPDTDSCGTDSGGAIRAREAPLEVADSVFSGNSGGYGAAVYFYQTTANVSGSSFVGNVSNSGCDGPAVYGANHDGLTISSSSFRDNTATDDEAGAVWSCSRNGAELTIVSSEFTDNHATRAGTGRGGAIFAFPCDPGNAPVLIANSTITGNTSTSGGGGVAVYGFGGSFSMSLYQTTITDNTAGGPGGGVLLADDGTGHIGGSILSDNTSTGEVGPVSVAAEDNGPSGGDVAALAAGPSDLFTEIPDQATGDHNIVGALEAPTELSGSDNQLGVDPLLGPLTDNGGPTRTRALLDGSPALNNGPDPVASFLGNEFDQRGPGFLRVVFGRVDVGAYEVQAPVEPIVLEPTFTG